MIKFKISSPQAMHYPNGCGLALYRNQIPAIQYLIIGLTEISGGRIILMSTQTVGGD